MRVPHSKLVVPHEIVTVVSAFLTSITIRNQKEISAGIYLSWGGAVGKDGRVYLSGCPDTLRLLAEQFSSRGL